MNLFICNVLFKTLVPMNKVRIWSNKFLSRDEALNETQKHETQDKIITEGMTTLIEKNPDLFLCTTAVL